MTSLSEQAEQYAIAAHESIHQKRKYSQEPYHFHCRRVVEHLASLTQDETILAAAWLHDVLEDVTPINPAYNEASILEQFGARVHQLVLELTDTPLSYGNRAMRKARDRERLRESTPDTKTIKLADLIDNFKDIQQHDPGYFKIYLREIELLMPDLGGGHQSLYEQLQSLIADAHK